LSENANRFYKAPLIEQRAYLQSSFRQKKVEVARASEMAAMGQARISNVLGTLG
jgi:hypothetical protein